MLYLIHDPINHKTLLGREGVPEMFAKFLVEELLMGFHDVSFMPFQASF